MIDESLSEKLCISLYNEQSAVPSVVYNEVEELVLGLLRNDVIE